VAVAFDAKRDRYYMMTVDKDHICVMVPNAEAGDSTPEEVIAKQAREGLGAKLVGAWKLAGISLKSEAKDATNSEAVSKDSTEKKVKLRVVTTEKSTDEPKAALSAKVRVAAPVISRVVADPYSSNYYQFDEDGVLHTKGGIARVDQAWECIRQEGNTLYLAQLSSGIQYLEYRVEFSGDDEIMLSVIQNERVLSSNRFQRTDSEVEPATTAE
jgi:hypothetical protein